MNLLHILFRYPSDIGKKGHAMILNFILAVITAAVVTILWFVKTITNLMVWMNEDGHMVTIDEVKEFTISLIELLSDDD